MSDLIRQSALLKLSPFTAKALRGNHPGGWVGGLNPVRGPRSVLLGNILRGKTLAVLYLFFFKFLLPDAVVLVCWWGGRALEVCKPNLSTSSTMEAVAAPDACVNPRSFMEESPAMAGGRRRMEIGRFKFMASCGNFADAMKKRSRTQGGTFCNSCFGEEEPSIDGDSDGGMDFENAPLQSQGLYPPGRLVRSVSTPVGWNAGLFCTCSAEKYWAKDGNPKEKALSGEDNAAGSGSRGNGSGKNAAVDESHGGSDGAEPMESEPHQGSAQQHNPTEGKPDAQQPTESDVGEGTLRRVEADQRSSDEKKNRNLKGICRANSESVSLLLKDPCPPHGTMSIIGRRREMEDAVSVIPSFFTLPKSSSGSGMQQGQNGFGASPPSVPLHFFAVYDGHGGSQASIFCKDHFHEALAQELRNSYGFSKDYTDWTKVMSACFTKMDIEVGGLCPNGSCGNGELDGNDDCCQDPIAPENVGSTAVIAVVSPSQVVIANCGDSRAVLCRGGRSIPLSKDHKPEREDEMTRIEAAGGRVICWNGYRVGGFLAMSRAIGDRYLKRYVISEPEVTCTERTAEDECLILASDGLWDVLSNDIVCEVARKCLAGYRRHRSKGLTEDTPVAAAAALLTKLALGRGSEDNISVVVIDLKEKRNRNR